MPRWVALFFILSMPTIARSALDGGHLNLKRLAALGNLACFFLLLGCAEMPHRQDVQMLHLVFQDKATYKQRAIWFERTTYESLVARGEYVMDWRKKGLSGAIQATPGLSVKQAVEQAAGQGEERPSFYFLVKGIGGGETLHSGNPATGEAGALQLAPGDLLIVDPAPTHLLFRKLPTR